MSIKRIEDVAVVGAVLENDHRPVVPRGRIVGKSMDYSWQWNIDLSAGLGKKIHTQMDNTAFVGWCRAGCEKLRSIDQACFVVAAYSDVHCCIGHLRKQTPGELRLHIFLRIAADQRAADTEIEYQAG